MDYITKKLLVGIRSEENIKQKSSHWIKYTKNFKFKNNVISGISGFSQPSKRIPFLDKSEPRLL